MLIIKLRTGALDSAKAGFCGPPTPLGWGSGPCSLSAPPSPPHYALAKLCPHTVPQRVPHRTPPLRVWNIPVHVTDTLAMAMSKALPTLSPSLSFLPCLPSIFGGLPVFLTYIYPRPPPQTQRRGTQNGAGRGEWTGLHHLYVLSNQSSPNASQAGGWGVTAESGYSSHSLPSPLPAQMPQALPLSDRPQPSGCSPHSDPSPRPALLPHAQRKEVTLPALLWGPAGRRGGGLYCLLLSPFPSLTTGSISPNQLHLRDLLPVVRKGEQRWRGIGSRHPPNTQPAGYHTEA